MALLGPWEPDAAGLSTGVLTVAKNVYPTPVGWGPVPSLFADGSNALASDCKGLCFYRTKAGAYQVYAGTSTKLYKLVSGTWTDYTRAVGGNYAVAAANFWRFAPYGDYLMAVNGTDAPQLLDVEGGATKFVAMAGSPPAAIDIGVNGDFVFLHDAANLRRVVNCGTTGPHTASSWTVGTDLCDEYIAPDGGNIASPMMLGEYGIFIQDNLARRTVLQPGDTTAAFRFEKIEGIKGPASRYGCAVAYNAIWYLAEEGFYVLGVDGTNQPIGSQRVNQWFRDNSDLARIDRVLAFVDPYSSRIFWAFYVTGSSTYYDGLIGYDKQLDRWFYIEQTAAFFGQVVAAGMTLEQVGTAYTNIDTMGISLDSRLFQGGRPTVGGVNSAGKLVFLSGDNLAATLTAAEVELNEEGRTFLSEAVPVGQFGDAVPALTVGKREYSGATQTTVGPFSRSTQTGAFYPRVSSRLLTFQLDIPASSSWSFAQDLRVKGQPDGAR